MQRKTTFVCLACGKQSHDLYGRQPINPGWDAACVMNAVEVYADSVVIENDRVTHVNDGGFVDA